MWASVISTLLLIAPVAQAEFILFPSLTATDHAGLNPHPDVHHAGHTPKQSGLNAEVDLFYAADKGRLRLLAEVFISNDEPLDIERLQAGWLATPETTVWLGRHHSPLGYWGTQFHHGAYLQTALRMRGALRASDTVARMGGDEFTILMPVVEDREHAAMAMYHAKSTSRSPSFYSGVTTQASHAYDVTPE